MKNILLTGGAGGIGLATIDLLYQKYNAINIGILDINN
ncbi:uncharacterized protein METZ01_LOCUS467180, partial [marine metagenome]